MRAAVREGFTRRPVHCEWTSGLLESAPVLFGMPLAEVRESECQARGGAQCLYTISWDAKLAAAAADPQERVTALEEALCEATGASHAVALNSCTAALHLSLSSALRRSP